MQWYKVWFQERYPGGGRTNSWIDVQATNGTEAMEKADAYLNPMVLTENIILGVEL